MLSIFHNQTVFLDRMMTLLSIWLGHTTIVQYLLDKGADLHFKNKVEDMLYVPYMHEYSFHVYMITERKSTLARYVNQCLAAENICVVAKISNGMHNMLNTL